ncbi:MAG: response regulator transcription factor [Treponema sp.]|nr:response regulator transcription factor [Treponema sp.]MBQ4236936.1 response regulator transcription factor [Treponema sp.]
MKKTFYIVDDHEMLREGTKGWFVSHSDWSCVGDAANHEAAYSDFERMAKKDSLPFILICDLNFFGENTGFDFMKKIHDLYPDVKIIVYSMFFAGGMVQNAIKNGASGYVSKNASCDDLLKCMEKSFSGEDFIQEELQPNLIKYSKLTDALTRREREVMELILQRHSNDEIANILNIKKRAVENYISLIYEKTGVNDRAELVVRYGG